MKAIIFDFDGTLVSSKNLVDLCLLEAFKNKGYENITKKDVLKNLGPTEEGIICKLTSNDRRDIFNEYLRLYEINHDLYLKDFIPGIRDLLNKAKEKYDIYLLTGRSKESLDISLKHLNATNIFKKCYSGNVNKVYKQENILKLLKENNLDKNDVIYVGDSYSDVLECKKAGIKIISVIYDDFENHELIEKENPSFLAKNLLDLKYFLEI